MRISDLSKVTCEKVADPELESRWCVWRAVP